MRSLTPLQRQGPERRHAGLGRIGLRPGALSLIFGEVYLRIKQLRKLRRRADSRKEDALHQALETERGVLSDLPVVRNQHEVMAHGLPDQHAIKRILVPLAPEAARTSGSDRI